MCFVKSSTPAVTPVTDPAPEPVVRHQADASATKNSDRNQIEGYNQNLKTSPYGIEEEAKTSKKTLLGD